MQSIRRWGWKPDIDVIEQMIFHYSLLPRLAISLLVGAGLGLVRRADYRRKYGHRRHIFYGLCAGFF